MKIIDSKTDIKTSSILKQLHNYSVYPINIAKSKDLIAISYFTNLSNNNFIVILRNNSIYGVFGNTQYIQKCHKEYKIDYVAPALNLKIIDFILSFTIQNHVIYFNLNDFDICQKHCLEDPNNSDFHLMTKPFLKIQWETFTIIGQNSLFLKNDNMIFTFPDKVKCADFLNENLIIIGYSNTLIICTLEEEVNPIFELSIDSDEVLNLWTYRNMVLVSSVSGDENVNLSLYETGKDDDPRLTKILTDFYLNIDIYGNIIDCYILSKLRFVIVCEYAILTIVLSRSNDDVYYSGKIDAICDSEELKINSIKTVDFHSKYLIIGRSLGDVEIIDY